MDAPVLIILSGLPFLSFYALYSDLTDFLREPSATNLPFSGLSHVTARAPVL